MKKFLLLMVCGVAIICFSAGKKLAQETLSTMSGQPVQLILDAGHGGEDGGAVSVTGVPESQINLAIVKKIDVILGFYGECPILTRDSDRSLHDESAVTLREKKSSDLKRRTEIVNETEGGVLISIHQNSFQSPKYQGSQVFYGNIDGSQELALHIQDAIRRTIQPNNSREVKKIAENVYLMNHIDRPAVLVECGFLTNPEEERQLRDADYQKQLAAVLAAAWLTSIRV